MKRALLILVLLWLYPAQAQTVKDEASATPPVFVNKNSDELMSEATTRVEPVYPPLAKSAKVSGTIIVAVIINEQGNVTSARVMFRHPLLNRPAIAAARDWKFKPQQVRGAL